MEADGVGNLDGVLVDLDDRLRILQVRERHHILPRALSLQPVGSAQRLQPSGRMLFFSSEGFTIRFCAPPQSRPIQQFTVGSGPRNW